MPGHWIRPARKQAHNSHTRAAAIKIYLAQGATDQESQYLRSLTRRSAFIKDNGMPANHSPPSFHFRRLAAEGVLNREESYGYKIIYSEISCS